MPALVVVANDFSIFQKGIEPLIPDTFSRLVFGNKLEDFQDEADGKNGNEDLVIAVGGAASHDVLKLFLQKKKETGRNIPWIHSLNTGVDSYRLAELKDLIGDIPVTNARGAFSSMLAEHIVFSMLYFNRYLWKLQQNKKDKKWDRHSNIELKGQTLGIVGYGDIAKECARKAFGMGVKVQAFKRQVKDEEEVVDDLGVVCKGGEAGLNSVLSTSDFVLAVLPATPQTLKFFTADRIALMKSSAVFINIGRGNTVDEDALGNALNTNALRGAALDVCAVEPLPQDHPFWGMDDSKLLLTPHNADVSDDIFAEAAATFGEFAKVFIEDGTIPDYRVDIDRGY